MKEGTRDLLVGVFVMASLAALGILMVWFGETPSWLGRAEWTLRIVGVTELSGISEGSPVNLTGVQIGRVKSLEFTDPERPYLGVVVVTRIGTLYSVPRGAIARIYGSTLGFGMGHIDIVVQPGLEAAPLDKKDATIAGEMRSVIGELISKELVNSVERMITHIGNLAESADPVAQNLSQLFEHRSVADLFGPNTPEGGLKPNLSTVIERFDNLLANVNVVLGDQDVQGDVRSAVRDLKTATEQLRDTFTLWNSQTQRIGDNINAGVDQTRENLDKSFAKLNEVLENLSDVSRSLAGIARGIEEGKGTMGLLVNDDRLYESAVLTFQRLTEAVGSLSRILAKIEEDGHINIGKMTPIGVITKTFPIGSQASKAP